MNIFYREYYGALFVMVQYIPMLIVKRNLTVHTIRISSIMHTSIGLKSMAITVAIIINGAG